MELYKKTKTIFCHFKEGIMKRAEMTATSSPDKLNMRLLVIVLLLCSIATCLVKANAVHNSDRSDIQVGIAENIIRFHVIANSDSSEDQALKLKVKDKLVERLSPLLNSAASIDEARRIISSNIDTIKQTAEETIKQYGYDYPVNVSLGDCFFPLKIYGSCTFPPGVYEALRVRIGEAEGKNWWCVMFPPLCFVDDTYSIVDDETDKKLKNILTEEEYDELVNQRKPVKIKFKLWETVKKLFD